MGSKMLKIFLLMVACIGLEATASNVVEEIRTVGNASRISIDSKVLKENRNLLVHLPDNYSESSKRYPVLYLLDGERHFNHAIMATQVLQNDERVPELIIVAITNSHIWGSDNSSRQRDLGYERENFTLYIKNEVMPYVNNNYRTSGLNTLFGHSLAGFFSSDLLATQPELFKNYIAASPVLQNYEIGIYEKILSKSKLKNTTEKSFYFSLASEDEARRKSVTDALNNFVKLLTEQPPEKLNWHYEFFDNQTHSTIYYPTFFPGMTYVFKSYQAPRFASYKAYMNFGGIQGMEAHYQKRAEIYGTDKNIPENTLLNVASMLLNNDQPEAALNLYRKLTNDFPESARSFSGLGQVYSAMKQFNKSITAHQTAVKLAEKHSPAWRKRLFKSRLEGVNKTVQLLNLN
jgi:predicted alpha/beta superfamily hydrolase